MYQSVYYDKPNKTYYLRDDSEAGFREFKYTPTYFQRISEYQEGALPILTGGFAAPTKQFDWDNPDLLEKDIDKELVVLRDLYYDIDDTIPSYQHIVYLDIETEMGGALTPQFIRDAPMTLTAIALIDITTKTKICFILDKEKKLEYSQDGNKIIIPCHDEIELFNKFLDKYEELDPTIISTWNGDFFDIPYLYYRGKRILGNKINKLSPIGKINAYTSLSKDKFGKSVEVNVVRLGGVSCLDYMLLHKKYITKQEPSYKLKDIGPKYCKLEKLEYEGNLNQLFEKDIHYFIDYNLRDVEIIEALEEKLKFIELTILICHDCCVPYEQIFSTTVLNEGKILRYLKKKGIVSNNKPTTDDPSLKLNKGSDYAGGFLLDPKIGTSRWGADFDASSHYPTIIISLNIGAETLIGYIENKDKYNCWLSLEELRENSEHESIIISPEGKTRTIKNSELVEFIIENDVLIAASGAMFSSQKKSILAEVLEDGFNIRQNYKAIMKEAGKVKDWDKYKLFNLKSTAIKYFINGCYGALALPTFRFSDGRTVLSKAVTLTGQRITQEVIREMNSYMLEDLNQK